MRFSFFLLFFFFQNNHKNLDPSKMDPDIFGALRKEINHLMVVHVLRQLIYMMLGYQKHIVTK